MAVPFFADLGQIIRNVLVSGYQVSVYKVDVQKKEVKRCAFNGGFSFFPDNRKKAMYLGGKFTGDHFGVGIKGNTSAEYKAEEGSDEKKNVYEKSVTGEGNASDEFLKFTTDYTHYFGSDKVTGHLKNFFRDELLAFTLGTEVHNDGVFMIDSSIVFAHKDILTGFEFGLNTQTKEIVKNNLAAQYLIRGCTLFAKVNTSDMVHLACHTKPLEDLETAAAVDWNPQSEEIQLTVGGKYNLEKTNTVLGARLDTKLAMGLNIKQNISEHLTLTVAAIFDCKNLFSLDKHKFGASLSIGF